MVHQILRSEVGNRTTFSEHYLDNTFATDTSPDKKDGDHTATSIDNDVRIKIEADLSLGQKLTEAKEKYTRRGEFARFRESLLCSATEARKAMRLFSRFKDWSVVNLLTINSVVSLQTLVSRKFESVVETLFEEVKLTKETVKRLVEEVRNAARVERQKKRVDPVTGWRQDSSGGGRHYQLPPMYDEQTALKIEHLAAEKNVMPLQVVKEAVQSFGTEVAVADDLRRQFQEELRAAVSEIRARHIQLERELLERDRRITDLEAQIRGLKEAPIVEVEASVSTWEQVEELSNRDQIQLLETVKTWSGEGQAKLPQLLSHFLEAEPQALELVNWVPEKLLSSALKNLSFVVHKITGENNLVDEPRLERIHGCRFVSLQNFGNRWEHWIFCSPDSKNFSVFGRDEFAIVAF